ncbi:MAG: hypothetical protein A2542_03340 [Parcubacteria group bacterium RIFOXYD2_FULL_52_8]|nr:MAG: hypothetical protein A2542_03340 [Parcubacteria group bacterium RIFOXYD2_FULL_52_8]
MEHNEELRTTPEQQASPRLLSALELDAKKAIAYRTHLLNNKAAYLQDDTTGTTFAAELAKVEKEIADLNTALAGRKG